MCSALFSLLIIIAPEDADFSLHIASLLLLPGLGDFLLLLLDLPERSKCSDLDLGIAELMQSANRSSSSCPVLSKLSIERSEREELKLLFTFGSKLFPPVARSAVSDAPVEDPELPDLVSWCQVLERYVQTRTSRGMSRLQHIKVVRPVA